MGLDVSTAVEHLARGPRGGDLTNPALNSEARRAHLNAEVLPNGTLGLHRKDGFTDTASRGKNNEQPWHTMAAYMLIAGRTNSEIALAANVHPNSVSQLRAQRWFQEKLAILANNEGEEITGVLKAEAVASLEKLVYLRDSAESERVQYAAAKDLLELAHGKAVQRTINLSATTHFDSPLEEYEHLQTELAALRESSS